MDVLGNFVDDEGSSYSQFGVPIDIGDYFHSSGTVKYDRQRNAQYTQMLSNRIVDRFYKENIILSSHLVAFVALTFYSNNMPISICMVYCDYLKTIESF